MSDCINCQCEEIVPGSTACASLKKQNDDRIKLHSLVLRDTTLCDLPEQTSKAMYSQWCFNKNITSQLCWLMNNSSGGKTYKAGKDISISNDGVISFTGTIPTPSPAYNDADLRAENTRLKNALMKIINNLTASGAWQGGLEILPQVILTCSLTQWIVTSSSVLIMVKQKMTWQEVLTNGMYNL